MTMVQRTRAQVDDQLRRARDHITLLTGTRYEAELVRAQAIVDTLTWAVEGGTAPWTEEATGVPDPARLAVEEQRAGGAEERARGALEDGTRPGVVAMTLSWLREHPRTPAPM